MVKLSLFSQITSLIPRDLFSDIVKKYKSDKYSKGIDSWTHLISMLFCHLGHANSVRDISNGLRSITGNINHLGCLKAPSKSTVSYVNENRDWMVFRDFYYVLADYFRKMTKFSKPGLQQLRRKVYLLDASIISLSLSLYDWAKFRTRKGAVKLHLLLDYDGCLPTFADLTHGKVHEIQVARKMKFPSDSILVFDMGYYDFSWWYNLDSMNIWFVTRAKDNLDYEIVENFDISEEKDKNVLQDCNIRLSSNKGKSEYPKLLRLVRYRDEVNGNELVFLTNNRFWTATTVSRIYKERWNIESFRISKTDLKVRPVYHRLPDRIATHICISFVAYTIYKEMERLLYLKAPEISIKKAIEATKKMYEATVVQPDKSKKIIELKKNQIQQRIISIIDKPD